jgi:hypothetical protein
LNNLFLPDKIPGFPPPDDEDPELCNKESFYYAIHKVIGGMLKNHLKMKTHGVGISTQIFFFCVKLLKDPANLKRLSPFHFF